MFTRPFSSIISRTTRNGICNHSILPTLPKYFNQPPLPSHYPHSSRRAFTTTATSTSKQPVVSKPLQTTPKTPSKEEFDVISPPPPHPPIQPPPPERTVPSQIKPVSDGKADELTQGLRGSEDSNTRVVGDISQFLLKHEFAITLSGVILTGVMTMGLYYEIRDEWARGDAFF